MDTACRSHPKTLPKPKCVARAEERQATHFHTRLGNRTKKRNPRPGHKSRLEPPPTPSNPHQPTPKNMAPTAQWPLPPPKSPARHRASFIPTRSDLHAAGGAGQACAREPPNWGPSRRLILGALRARECCARTKLTNGSCSCAKIGEFGSDQAVIGLGVGGKGLYRQEGGGSCWFGWVIRWVGLGRTFHLLLGVFRSGLSGCETVIWTVGDGKRGRLDHGERKRAWVPSVEAFRGMLSSTSISSARWKTCQLPPQGPSHRTPRSHRPLNMMFLKSGIPLWKFPTHFRGTSVTTAYAQHGEKTSVAHG